MINLLLMDALAMQEDSDNEEQSGGNIQAQGYEMISLPTDLMRVIEQYNSSYGNFRLIGDPIA